MTASYVHQIRGYYDELTAAYVSTIGTTIQSSFIAPHDHSGDFLASNLYLAREAGIAPGHRILDAGCGVCGPAIDIASHVPNTRIDAVTVSPVQVALARQYVEAAGLRDRVSVHESDFHQLPFQNGTFDVVYFFESSGYTEDFPALAREVRRLLKPGGTLYVKDFFKAATATAASHAEAVEEFNRVYRYTLRTVEETVEALRACGFLDPVVRDLEPLSSYEYWQRAMYEFSEDGMSLSALGQSCSPMLAYNFPIGATQSIRAQSPRLA